MQMQKGGEEEEKRGQSYGKGRNWNDVHKEQKRNDKELIFMSDGEHANGCMFIKRERVQ